MSNELITRLYDEAQDNPDSLEWKAADLIEAQQKRIEELKDKLFDAKGKASEKRIELICNLAAAQAQISVFREALENTVRHFGLKRLGESRLADTEIRGAAHKALAMPSDDSALREMLKAERERCAKRCEEIDVAAFGSDRPAPNDCANAIRAMEDK